MKLEELKKKLYKPESEFEKRFRVPESFQTQKERGKKESEEWKKEKKKFALFSFTEKQKTYFIFGGLLFVFISLCFSGFMVWRGLNSFDVEKVKLTIIGPERIVSGEEIIYRVECKNETKSNLTDLKLIFRYPEGTIRTNDKNLVESLSLEDLSIGQKKEIEFPVRVIGLEGDIKSVSAELTYRPENITSYFANKTDFSSEIISVPLLLSFDIPDKLVSGQSFEFSLKFLNQSDISFDDLQVKLTYPSGFNFESAEPQPLENDSIWLIEKSDKGEEVKFFIKGNISGAEGETKTFKAQAGILENNGDFTIYSEEVNSLEISSSPLSVTQTVNKSSSYIAKVGERLNYSIFYKNTTDVGIRNVVITSKIQGAALDLGTMNLREGSFNTNSQTVTWKASNLPELDYLDPGEEGEVSFSIKIKDLFPINNYNDKNFEVINEVKVDSLQAPLSLKDIDIAGKDRLLVKIKSNLVLQTQAYYLDDAISNSGPIPPKVGEKTTYTVKLRLTNAGNDLSGVKVKAFLPPHVEWLNNFKPSNSNVSYNNNSGQVVWSIGDLPSATGVLSPVKELVFQIAITPGQVDVGHMLELIGKSEVSGYDDFAETELSATDKAIDTDLPDDPTINRSKGIIAQ